VAGKRLGLVTSKSADTTQMAFRAVGLEQHFDVVVTASDTTEHKPRPAPILLCLERLGAGHERLGAGHERPIYIGDSPYDVAAGKAAGIATAAVTWGLFSADDLADAGPDHLLTRPDEIVAVCLEGEEG
jgi:pyrophosphatase PpaX